MYQDERRVTTPSLEGVAIIGRFVSALELRGLMVAVIGVLCMAVSPLEAQRHQDRPNAIEAERAIAQLRSPYCPGFMLEVCTSGQAAALRDSIFMLAAEGMVADELVEWMIANHGEEWRALPPRTGAGLWAWIVPPVAMLLGLGLVVGWIRMMRRPDEGASDVRASTVSSEDRERLVAAMRELEESGEEVV